MAPTSARALHYVVKVADRTATVHFLREALGMHTLRHEEFSEGCEAACNGPYAGRWSKTMMGFGPESNSFVLELTYNYGVASYRLGNDHCFFKLRSRGAFRALEEQGLGEELSFGVREAKSPDGHTFLVMDEEDAGTGPLTSVCLAVSDLGCSLAYWTELLGFLEVDRGDDWATLSTGTEQATLRLQQLPAGAALDRGTGYGRIAYSCPAADLAPLQEEVLSRGFTVLTPLVTLDTPGKAPVQVVILADPDGHEICFVGDEAFRELSRMDDHAAQLLDQAMSRDTSRGAAPAVAGSVAAAPAAPAAPPAPAAAPPAAPPAGVGAVKKAGAAGS